MNNHSPLYLLLLAMLFSATLITAQTTSSSDTTATDKTVQHKISDSVSRLTVSSGSNPYGIVSCSGTLPSGTSVLLSTSYDLNHEFSHWTNGSGNSSTTVEVYSDMTINPVYNGKTFSITLSCDESMGSVQGGGQYEYDTEVTIEATPHSGFRFLQWNDGDLNPARKIIIRNDLSLQAQFVEEGQTVSNLNIRSENTDQGTISVKAYAEPRRGYYFYRWSDGDYNNPRFININENADMKAQFRYESQQAGRKQAASHKHKNRKNRK